MGGVPLGERAEEEGLAQPLEQTPALEAAFTTPTPAPPHKGEGKCAGQTALKLAAVVVLVAIAATTALALYARSLPPLDLDAARDRSTVVLDREGRLLRPFLTADGRWKLPVGTRDVDPRYLAMLKTYEDRRFDSHPGIDPLGLARAALQMVTSGRVVSGGSTLTMQVARLLEPREERDLSAKLRQAVRAVELERRLGKDEILDLYLRLAPFGGNLEGVRAASFAYFGKEPKRLSTAEAALLVALPQSPETRRPDRLPQAAERARERVLARVASAGLATPDEIAAARQEPIPAARKPFPNLSPHLAEQVVAEAPAARSHALTLDARLQANLESLARERVRGLDPQLSVAILAVDNETGEVRASVGGVDYFAAERAGSLDLTRALRSPGSALKPFIYALAFDNGIAHPETMLEDRPARYGFYVPENFDMTFQGMVSARKALQLSLNVPTVELLSALGPQRFLSRLRETNVAIAMPKEGGAPGLAVGLGGLGITLADLTKLYVGLARGGEVIQLAVRPMQSSIPSPRLRWGGSGWGAAPLGETMKDGAPAFRPPTPALPTASGGREIPRLVEPVAAWYVADSLLGAPPPLNGPPGRIAYKTGTSYGYRDAWAVGFDRKHTIGIWVGRADNGAVPGLVGRVVAAPILFDAFARLGIDPRPFPQPPDAIVAATSHLPPPLRHLRQDVPKTVAAIATPGLKLAFPPDGARIDLTEGSGDLPLKVSGGAPPYTWLVDGAPVLDPTRRRETAWRRPGRGFLRISVIDGTGASESVSVRVQ